MLHFRSISRITRKLTRKNIVAKFFEKMSTPARRRLMRDFKRLQQDPPAGVSGAPRYSA